MNGWNNSKQFLRRWRKKHIKTWYLLVLLVVFTTVSVLALRHNNLTMVALREKVIVADKQNGDVASAIADLNADVFHHMNTQIVRPVELVNTYNRRAQAVITAANQQTGTDIYAEATAACERRGIPLTAIAECAAEYALAHNPDLAQKKIILPDKSRFTYTFASPLWTPDLAGFSLLITGVILVWLIARLIEYVLVRLTIRHRLKNGF